MGGWRFVANTDAGVGGGVGDGGDWNGDEGGAWRCWGRWSRWEWVRVVDSQRGSSPIGAGGRRGRAGAGGRSRRHLLRQHGQ